MKQDKMIALMNTALGMATGAAAWYVSKSYDSTAALALSAAAAVALNFAISKHLKLQKTAIWLFAFVLLLTWTFLFNVLA
ncbi:MAG: hypothetical protein V1731_01530 [Candidatus Aenigmatarchaeota archaeon]